MIEYINGNEDSKVYRIREVNKSFHQYSMPYRSFWYLTDKVVFFASQPGRETGQRGLAMRVGSSGIICSAGAAEFSPLRKHQGRYMVRV